MSAGRAGTSFPCARRYARVAQIASGLSIIGLGHVVSGLFPPLIDLINGKRAGQPIARQARPAPGNVVNLMDALRASLGQEHALKSAKKPKKATGQKEMLLPIEGKKPAKEGAAKKAASKQQRRSA